MNREKDIVTRAELATYLQVSYQTIINYERRGLIHGAKLGRRIYYKREEIEQLLTK